MEKIGRYKIVGELGRGAMGVVYKAQDPAIGRLIAIKSIRLDTLADESERDRMRERLLREAQSAGILSHPGIVTIYDVAEEDNMAYIFMEIVNGPPLEKVLKSEHPPDKATILSIFRQIAIALDFAHKKGIVHRDIKPANIMVHEDGTAKITDFGVAKIVSQQMTRAGTIMGTPSYMSPEQVHGGEVSGRTDQFSLAVIAYEILTGEKPFTAEYLPTLLFKIVREDPIPPHRLNPTLMPIVETVMSRALAKDPTKRYETCLEFVDALAAACAASENWVPLSRGAMQNMPTTNTEMGNLAETVMEPHTVILPPKDKPAAPSIGDAQTVILSTPPTSQPPKKAEPAAPITDDDLADAPTSKMAIPPAFSKKAALEQEKKQPQSAAPAPTPLSPTPSIDADAPTASYPIQPVKAKQPPQAAKPPASQQPPPAAQADGSGANAATEEVAIPSGKSTKPAPAASPEKVPAAATFTVPPESAPSGNGLKFGLIAAAVVVVAGAAFFFMRGSEPATTAEPSTVAQAEPAAPTPESAAPTAAPTPAPSPAPAPVAAAPAAPKAPPAPTEAAFQLTTSPAGASVTFDNNPELQCTSPCSINLPVGRHTFVVKHDGYRDAQRVFVLPTEDSVSVPLDAAGGTLSLVTVPAGLTFTVDGKEQGRKTPANILLPVGNHRVQVMRGNDKQEFTVEIRDGFVTQRSLEWAQ